MLTPALRLDMALYSTSIAYDLAPPIVALPVVSLRTVQILCPTLLHYK